MLVLPRRVVPRITDLNADEVSDLFLAVQSVGRAVERAYGAEALTVSVQVCHLDELTVLLTLDVSGSALIESGRSSCRPERAARPRACPTALQD